MKNANKPWNNMKHYIIMFLTIPVLYSCFDLDEVPYTSLSPNNFYKDSKELEMGVKYISRIARHVGRQILWMLGSSHRIWITH